MTTETMLKPSLSKVNESSMFEKRTVSELSESELMEIDGGTSPLFITAAAAGIFYSGYLIGQGIYNVTH